ncbi:MAG: hypothetical protein HYY66_08135 [Candidatus Tectomicrobia bacterium]|nr:hypothetical protein [Candidatus Tectomicrobia bacterium]
MEPGALNLTTEVTGHGRFLFVRLPGGEDRDLIRAWERLGEGMENAHRAEGPPSPAAFRRGRYQLLRALPALSRACDLPHPSLLDARALVRIEAASPEPLAEYEEGLRRAVERIRGSVESLAGVQRPRSYTSQAMTRFAYEKALAPGPGARLPYGVAMFQNKTPEWWAMDWMRRESFFLPRYGEDGAMIAEGHALAAREGIPSIVRRLFHREEGYGLPGGYDFLTYFEFAEESAETFRAVMAALRDVRRNPEWSYVREGPEWWGWRVAKVEELWV